MTSNEMSLIASIAVDMQKNEVDEVLDKIRAEIAEVIDCKEPACKAQDNFNGGLQVALQIIDKYRKEQE